MGEFREPERERREREERERREREERERLERERRERERLGFLPRLHRAFEDEREAYERYGRYAGGARTNPMFPYLWGSMASDEYRHAQMLYPYVSSQTQFSLEKAVGILEVTHADIEEAIRGELMAIAGYAELAAMAPTSEERMMFVSIIGDEYGHLRILMSMEQLCM